jgi:hypothetical protein
MVQLAPSAKSFAQPRRSDRDEVQEEKMRKVVRTIIAGAC